MGQCCRYKFNIHSAKSSIYNLRARNFDRDVFKDAGIITVASQFVYYNILFVLQNIQCYIKNSNKHTIGMK